jgi:pimeloyl-ACP methyl ester carboxylesterase
VSFPRRARRAAWSLGALVGITGGGGVAFEHVGAAAIVYAPNAGHPPDPAADPPPPPSARAHRVDAGPPHASLALLILDPPGGAQPAATVFVLHGIRDRKESMLGWARGLASEGYRAVLVDGRGHGRSSGELLTYGVQEARDLTQVLDALSRDGLVAGRVAAMGVSYGAATAIEWAGVEPRIAAVVAVAPFASLRAVVPGYVRLILPGIGALVPGFFVDRTITRAGTIAGFDPDAASPLDAVTHTRAPVLLIHGRADANIPPDQSEAIHARAPDHSELVLVDGEDHIGIAADRSQVVWRSARGWFGRWLGAGD